MKNSALHNFHLPLPDDLYSELRSEARRANVPATALARQALEEWLRQKRRADLHRAIADYAAEHAGAASDLDEQLEAAAVEHLLDDGPAR